MREQCDISNVANPVTFLLWGDSGCRASCSGELAPLCNGLTPTQSRGRGTQFC